MEFLQHYWMHLMGTGGFFAVIWAFFFTGLKDWLKQAFWDKIFKTSEPPLNGNGYLKHSDFERFITTVITRPEYEARQKELNQKLDSYHLDMSAKMDNTNAHIDKVSDKLFDKMDNFIQNVLLHRDK